MSVTLAQRLTNIHPCMMLTGHTIGRAYVHAQRILLALERGTAATSSTKTLLHMAWEELHSGSWEHVSVAWREAYTLATISSAIDSLEASECQQDTTAGDWNTRAEACLRSLDVSVIVGGPRMANVVHSFINILHMYMVAASGPAHQAQCRVYGANPAQPNSALEPLKGAGLPLCSGTCSLVLPCSQRLSTLEAVDAPGMLGFEHRFMNRSEPCLMNGVAESWPAMERCACHFNPNMLCPTLCPLFT